MQRTTPLGHYLPLLRTLLAIRQKSQEPGFWEVMDSFVVLGYASLQQLLASQNFTFKSEDLSFQRKKVISMNDGSSTSSWKPWRWVRLDLTFSMRDIYINSDLNSLTKLTSSSRSSELKDILSWNISQMITNTIPISTRIVISYAIKQGILLWIWWKVNGYWYNNMIKISQWRESHCRANTSIKRNK